MARNAQKSLLYEAAVYPKPGLVTPLDNGSHKDMNHKTFIDSALSLLPCFISCASIGFETCSLPPADILPMLRAVGKQGEKEMYGATNGVNAHKGAIFLLGLLVAASARVFALRLTLAPKRIAEVAAAFVAGIVRRELTPLLDEETPAKGLSEHSAGELAYILHRIDGPRGEAERGFPTVLSALAEMKNMDYIPFSFNESAATAQLDAAQTIGPESLLFREKLAHILIYIMADNADSNLISRGGFDALTEVRNLSRDATAAGGMKTPAGRNKIADMEKTLVQKNLSPGGSADILSCALFLRMTESMIM